ncbi:DUF4139 domain-containing protein [Arhodomonas sp. SL1]|uniref:DUF4139 domain-containing protein n=1 Tax=Arhodomonas sp. SL1 TaxID=3425691 RepID=UPI003F885341
MRRSIAVTIALSALPAAAAGAMEVDTEALVLQQEGAALVAATATVPAGQGEASLEGLPEGLRFPTLSVSDDTGRAYPLRRTGGKGLLADWIGREVLLIDDDGNRREGRLLGLEGGTPVVHVDDHMELIDEGSPWRIALPGDGLPVRDAIRVIAAAGRNLRLDYLTDGLDWQADYTLHLHPNGNRLSGHATLRNTSGATYRDAAITLVAGDIRDDAGGGPRPTELMARTADAATMPEAEQAGDWYRYALPGRHLLDDGAQLRLPLLAAAPVDTTRHYEVRGDGTGRGGNEPPVRIRLGVEPTGEHLRPLPAGSVRVIDRGKGGPMLQGVAPVGHIPPGEGFSLALGSAFDLRAEREQTEWQRLGGNAFEAGWRITVQNAGEEARTVTLTERMHGDWELLEHSAAPVSRRADAAVWELSVPAGDEAVLDYRLRVRQ